MVKPFINKDKRRADGCWVKPFTNKDKRRADGCGKTLHQQRQEEGRWLLMKGFMAVG